MQFHNVTISIDKNGLDIFSNGLDGLVSFDHKLLYGSSPLITLGRATSSIKKLGAELDSCTCKLLKITRGLKNNIAFEQNGFDDWEDKQRKSIIKQQIRESNVGQNLNMAHKYIPKQYQSPVPMLAIKCKINGHAIKVVID